jgi:maltooligosyltrehalose trehalohydrolase
LLALRRERVVPRLPGAASLGAEAVGDGAVLARWRLGDGSRLTIGCNLGASAVPASATAGEPLFESADGAATSLASGTLPAHACVALLEPPAAAGASTEKDAR